MWVSFQTMSAKSYSLSSLLVLKGLKHVGHAFAWVALETGIEKSGLEINRRV